MTRSGWRWLWTSLALTSGVSCVDNAVVVRVIGDERNCSAYQTVFAPGIPVTFEFENRGNSEGGLVLLRDGTVVQELKDVAAGEMRSMTAKLAGPYIPKSSSTPRGHYALECRQANREVGGRLRIEVGP